MHQECFKKSLMQGSLQKLSGFPKAFLQHAPLPRSRNLFAPDQRKEIPKPKMTRPGHGCAQSPSDIQLYHSRKWLWLWLAREVSPVALWFGADTVLEPRWIRPKNGSGLVTKPIPEPLRNACVSERVQNGSSAGPERLRHLSWRATGPNLGSAFPQGVLKVFSCRSEGYFSPPPFTN